MVHRRQPVIGLGLKKDAVPKETGYFDQTKEWLELEGVDVSHLTIPTKETAL